MVGAGIYGALAAWEAARHGLTVALIDRADFGGATSFNSLKTLHGGLRSLQSLNLTQMRLFIRERRGMAQMAPHLVDVLPFCVPTYLHPTRNAVALRIALAITDTVGYDRNDGIVDETLQLPRGRVVLSLGMPAPQSAGRPRNRRHRRRCLVRLPDAAGGTHHDLGRALGS